MTKYGSNSKRDVPKTFFVIFFLHTIVFLLT